MKKHIHKYQRRKLGKSVIYKCMIGGCSHFIQKELAEGRACICNLCGAPFIINKITLKNCPAKPHCISCTKTNNKDKAIESILDDMII